VKIVLAAFSVVRVPSVVNLIALGYVYKVYYYRKKLRDWAKWSWEENRGSQLQCWLCWLNKWGQRLFLSQRRCL